MNDDEQKIQRRKQIEVENAALWSAVTKDVKPIDRRDIAHSLGDIVENPAQNSRVKPSVRVRETFPELSLSGKMVKSRELDGRTQQRLQKGQMEIEARLDLHGLNQIQAYDALMAFIRKAVAREMRCVLVITGKGKKQAGSIADTDLERGVLQQRVPEWLNEQKMHEHILRTQQAQPKDGGGGALYVLLRRQRS